MKLDFRTLRKDEEGKYFVTDTETDLERLSHLLEVTQLEQHRGA